MSDRFSEELCVCDEVSDLFSPRLYSGLEPFPFLAAVTEKWAGSFPCPYYPAGPVYHGDSHDHYYQHFLQLD